MATIRVLDILTIGVDDSEHTYTDYVISKDENMVDIIEMNLFESLDKYEYSTPLKIDDNKYYSGEFDIYAFVRVWFLDKPSPWFVKKFNKEIY
jgi:hypothetical protein